MFFCEKKMIWQTCVRKPFLFLPKEEFVWHHLCFVLSLILKKLKYFLKTSPEYRKNTPYSFQTKFFKNRKTFARMSWEKQFIL
jgi:hypothetical protein